MKNISLGEVEYIAFRMAKECLTFNEPIPDFSARFPNILESCIAMPFMKFGGRYLYKTLVARAGILFYLLIKNHPFKNGNKSVAITTLLVFLYKNDKWLSVETKGLYNFTVWIAESPSELKDVIVRAIEVYIKKHVVSLDGLVKSPSLP